MQLAEILAAVEILQPIVEDLVKYLRGGKFPDSLMELPNPTRSRLVFAAKLQRDRLRGKGT